MVVTVSGTDSNCKGVHVWAAGPEPQPVDVFRHGFGLRPSSFLKIHGAVVVRVTNDGSVTTRDPNRTVRKDVETTKAHMRGLRIEEST